MEEQNNRLYVGNLPYSLTDEGLQKLFAEVADVEEAVVITDRASGRSKGFGFVTMKDEKAAQKAAKEMNEKDVEGRPLKVDIARPRREE